MKNFGDIKSIIKANRAELAQGTVLAPFDHPSYSAEKSADLKELAFANTRWQEVLDASTEHMANSF